MVDDDPKLTETVPHSQFGTEPKRFRRALRSHREVILGWARNELPEGYTNTMLFEFGTIYSYRRSFPVARHVRIPTTHRRLVFFTKEDGSVTTQCHKTAIYRHVHPFEDRGISVIHVHDVMADTRSAHQWNFDLLLKEADEYAGKWKRGRSNKEFYGDRAASIVLAAFEYSCEVGLGSGLDPATPFAIVSDWFRERDRALLAELLTGLHREARARSA